METSGGNLVAEKLGNCPQQVQEHNRRGVHRRGLPTDIRPSARGPSINTVMENRRGELVFIFAGYNKDMEGFITHNKGLRSRIPYTLQFEDFTGDELLTILKRNINEKYGSRMNIEAHPDDTDQES